MALLFMDGFEHYVTADILRKWDGNVGVCQILSAITARTGSKYGSVAGGGGFCKTIIPGDGTVIVGVGFYRTQVGIGGVVIESGGFNSSSWYQCTVAWEGDLSIVVRRGGEAGTIIAQSSPGIARLSTWNYLEFKILMSQTVGTALVKLNGATVINASGLDTCHQANTNWTGVRFNPGGYGHIDDVYICDGTGSVNNDLLGECRVVTLLPQTDAVAAGSNADFTCSSSTDHGALVDEAAPDDDTSYVYSSTPNHVDSWNYPALGYSGTIKGVQMNLSAKKSDSGTRAIAAVTRPVTTNRVHATNHYIGSAAYIYWMSLWELNPEDSAAWEVADVDGAEFGVKVTA